MPVKVLSHFRVLWVSRIPVFNSCSRCQSTSLKSRSDHQIVTILSNLLYDYFLVDGNIRNCQPRQLGEFMANRHLQPYGFANNKNRACWSK